MPLNLFIQNPVKNCCAVDFKVILFHAVERGRFQQVFLRRFNNLISNQNICL